VVRNGKRQTLDDSFDASGVLLEILMAQSGWLALHTWTIDTTPLETALNAVRNGGYALSQLLSPPNRDCRSRLGHTRPNRRCSRSL
jgi:hypothetical protein